MEFTVEEAKALLEKYLREELDGMTVKEYMSVSDAEGPDGEQTRNISVIQSDDHIRHYCVDQRGSDKTTSI